VHPTECLDPLEKIKKTLAVTGNRFAIPRLCRPCLVTILTEISLLLCCTEISLLFTRHGDSVSMEPQAVLPHVVSSLLHLCISFLDTTADDYPDLSPKNKSMAV
jgi:hypothetical protein